MSQTAAEPWKGFSLGEVRIAEMPQEASCACLPFCLSPTLGEGATWVSSGVQRRLDHHVPRSLGADDHGWVLMM